MLWGLRKGTTPDNLNTPNHEFPVTNYNRESMGRDVTELKHKISHGRQGTLR